MTMEPETQELPAVQPVKVESTRTNQWGDPILSDTWLFEQLVEELGDPFRVSAEVKTITHGRPR